MVDADTQHLTILFADVADSTNLYQAEGDVGAHQLIADGLRLIASVVNAHQGILLRTVGDATLASFVDPERACQAAIAIQKGNTSRRLNIRIGFHCGEVIPDGGDIYGTAVNAAARVATFAVAGEICATQLVVDQLSTPLRSRTEFLDRVAFKGIDQPMQVCRVLWSDRSESTEVFTAVSLTEQFAELGSLCLTIGSREILVDAHHHTVKLGRSGENDIIVEHESTSRQHAVVSYAKGQYWLKDNSTNGTYLLRDSGRIDLLRRNELALSGPALIGLGWSPADDDRRAVRVSLAP